MASYQLLRSVWRVLGIRCMALLLTMSMLIPFGSITLGQQQNNGEGNIFGDFGDRGAEGGGGQSGNWEYRTEVNDLFATTRPESEKGLLYPKLIRYVRNGEFYIYLVHIKEQNAGELNPRLWIQLIDVATGNMVRNWDGIDDGDEVDSDAGFNTGAKLTESSPDVFKVVNVDNDAGTSNGAVNTNGTGLVADSAFVYIASLERPTITSTQINIRRYTHTSTPESTPLIEMTGRQIDAGTQFDIYGQYESYDSKEILFVLYSIDDNTKLVIERFEIRSDGSWTSTGRLLKNLPSGSIADTKISDLGGSNLINNNGNPDTAGKFLITFRSVSNEGVSDKIYTTCIDKFDLDNSWTGNSNSDEWKEVADEMVADADGSIPPFKIIVDEDSDNTACVYRRETSDDMQSIVLTAFDGFSGDNLVDDADYVVVDGEGGTDGGVPLQFDAILGSRNKYMFTISMAYILDMDDGTEKRIYGAEMKIEFIPAPAAYKLKWGPDLLSRDPTQNPSDPVIIRDGTSNGTFNGFTDTWAVVFWKEGMAENDYIYARKIEIELEDDVTNSLEWGENGKVISNAVSRKGSLAATESYSDNGSEDANEYVVAWEDDGSGQSEIYGGMITGGGDYGGELAAGEDPQLSFDMSSGSPAIKLEWTYPREGEEEMFPLSTIEYFSIERKIGTGGGNNYTEIGRTASNETHYLDEDVSVEDSMYSYRYKAHRRDVEGTLSGNTNLTTPALFAPSLAANAISGTEIRISVTNNSPTALGLEIDRSTDGVTFETFYSGDILEGVTDAGLELETTYYYRARVASSELGDDGDDGVGESEAENSGTIVYSEYLPPVSATTTSSLPEFGFFGSPDDEFLSGPTGLSSSIPEYLGSARVRGSSCFVATASYKNMEGTKVRNLISMRDITLRNCVAGALSVKLYREMAMRPATGLPDGVTSDITRTIIRAVPISSAYQTVLLVVISLLMFRFIVKER